MSLHTDLVRLLRDQMDGIQTALVEGLQVPCVSCPVGVVKGKVCIDEQIAVGEKKDGSLMLFYIGTDKRIWYNSQKSSQQQCLDRLKRP